MTTTFVTARLTARPERIEDAKREMLGLVEDVRKEPGCIRYDLHQDPKTPTNFLLYETWESAEILDTHSKAPALTEFRKRTGDLFAGDLDIAIWHSLEP